MIIRKILKNLLKIHSPPDNGENQKNYWDSQSPGWKYIAEPFRPSREELRYYENFLNAAEDKKRILLLGSTPELRDLLARHYDKSKIYVCDFSWKMLEEMTKELKYANQEKEIWIKADWTDIALPQNFFDAVIGDLIFMQFPPDQTENFLKKISGLLIEGGVFIVRSRCRKDFRKPVKELIYDAISKKNVDNINKAAAALLWELYDVCTKNNDSVIDKEKAATVIKEYINKTESAHPLLTYTLKKIERTIKENAFRWHWTYPFEKNLSDLLNKVFYIKDRQTGNSRDNTAHYPIFLLEKRS